MPDEGQFAVANIPAPFMATAVTMPRSIRSVMIGASPTLITWAPTPTMTGRRFRCAFTMAWVTARNALTAKMSGGGNRRPRRFLRVSMARPCPKPDLAVSLVERIRLEVRRIDRRDQGGRPSRGSPIRTLSQGDDPLPVRTRRGRA